MSTNDITQTSKEFSERNKRLKLKQSYVEKENQKLNEIENIDKEIERLKLKKAEKEREYNDISSDKLQKLSILYNDTDLLLEIVEFAKHTTFSNSMLNDINQLCGIGINSDTIDIDLIEKITLAEESINSEIKHTNKISDIFSDFGASVKFPGERSE